MNPTQETVPTDEYDSPWKDVLEHAFPEFMAYYFPAAHSQIDWPSGHEFKNTELRQVVRDAELGKRHADALVQVTLNNGEASWVYIHIEVQGRREADFAQRMFTYNYRLYDRYATPIASLAVLADDEDGWKPDHYGYEVLGCRHHLNFPVAKLNELAARIDDLEAETNPFALITIAHQRTRQTRHDPEARYQAKRILVRLLYRHGWTRKRILDLFAVLDWMMRLPSGLEQKLWQDIEQIEGESKMRYVTSIERLATERGMQQGMQQGKLEGKLEGETSLIERQITRRFGPPSPDTQARLKAATLEQIEQWAENILDATTLEDVFKNH